MNRFVSGAKLQDKPGYTAMKFDPFGGARLQIDPENERTAVANVRSLRAAVARGHMPGCHVSDVVVRFRNTLEQEGEAAALAIYKEMGPRHLQAY